MDSGGDREPRPRRVTDSDVAHEAGVSRATVYYVLNDDPKRRIPDPTRQRVLDAVERLGYVPYGPARLLRGGRSSVVLLLTHGLEHATDYVATGIVRRLGAALEDRGLHLVWRLADEGSEDPAINLAPVIVLSSAPQGDDAFESARATYPVPVLEAFPGLDSFLAGAAEEQVAHLVERGRRTLAYVTPQAEAFQATARIRHRAADAAAQRLGLSTPLLLAVPEDRAAAVGVITSFLAAHPEVDALCAYNDEVAFVVLAALSDAGVPIPSRVAVIGVDDHPFARSSIPALTTVATDVDAFVDAFADQIAGISRGQDAAGATLPRTATTIPRATT